MRPERDLAWLTRRRRTNMFDLLKRRHIFRGKERTGSVQYTSANVGACEIDFGSSADQHVDGLIDSGIAEVRAINVFTLVLVDVYVAAFVFQTVVVAIRRATQTRDAAGGVSAFIRNGTCFIVERFAALLCRSTTYFGKVVHTNFSHGCCDV